MKNIIIKIVFFILIATSLLNACSNPQNNENTIIDFDFNKIHESSFNKSENQFRFLELISNNSIDAHYNEVINNFKDTITRQELIRKYKDFVDIWTEEFEYSYHRYADLLNAEVKDDYIVAQNSWYDSITKLHGLNGNAALPASWSDLERDSIYELMVELRRHTLYIKY